MGQLRGGIHDRCPSREHYAPGYGLFVAGFFDLPVHHLENFLQPRLDDFGQRLRDITAQHQKDKDELKARITGLESDLARYQNAFGSLEEALLDAHQHAAHLKQKSEEDARRIHAENIVKAAEQEKRLILYQTAIDDLRRRLTALAQETDQALLAYYNQAEQLKEQYTEKESEQS